MILATHMLGLTGMESGALLLSTTPETRKAATAQAIAARYAEVQAAGWLIARQHQAGWDRGAPGRSFDYDALAEESGYVFLETHSRYMDYYAPALYGWQFDAEQLVLAGALVCDADLGAAFDDAIYQACVEVAATLPRLLRVSEAEIAALLGEHDPDLLVFVAAQSEDPIDALHNAVRGHAIDDPIAPEAIAQARALAVARCRAIKAARRLGGDAALALLRCGAYCEIVMPDRLPLAWAVVRIEGGQYVQAAAEARDGEIL